MTTRIVLAVDGRPAGDAATRWAIARANRAGTSLRIVSVATDDDLLADLARRAVARAVATARRTAPGLRVTGDVVRANVVDGLLLESADADLLVVGSDRPSSLLAALLGSLPMRLSGRVGCDLLVVPRGWRDTPGRGVVAVGWDDDRVGSDALEIAAREAEAIGAAVRIVHVWMSLPRSPSALDGVGDWEGRERARTATVEEVAERARRRHPDLTFTSELHLGPVAGALLSRRHQTALVVVGSHRRGALGDLVFGSTGDALIRASDAVPILIARTSDRLARVRASRERTS
jgi:nucleotide-binding universal stress UspA family protein